jgi:hypothetical protein
MPFMALHHSEPLIPPGYSPGHSVAAFDAFHGIE